MMESFYVLSHKGKFVFDVKFDPEAPAFKKLVMPTSQLSSAKRFETLCEALEFNDSSELGLQVLKVEITVAYAPDLFTENVPK